MREKSWTDEGQNQYQEEKRDFARENHREEKSKKEVASYREISRREGDEDVAENLFVEEGDADVGQKFARQGRGGPVSWREGSGEKEGSDDMKETRVSMECFYRRVGVVILVAEPKSVKFIIGCVKKTINFSLSSK